MRSRYRFVASLDLPIIYDILNLQGYPQTEADPPKFYAPKPQAPDTLYGAPPIEAASETKPGGYTNRNSCFQ